MKFQDRSEAGEALAQRLTSYRGQDRAIVVGIGKEGHLVAKQVAQELDLPLTFLAVGKIHVPESYDHVLGAITVDDHVLLDERAIKMHGVAMEAINEAISIRKIDISRSEQELGSDFRGMDLDGKTTILISDGICTGMSMKVSMASVRSKKCSKVVVAVPVGIHSVCQEIQKMADEFVCIHTPARFHSINRCFASDHAAAR